jgi:HEAT repeat protein
MSERHTPAEEPEQSAAETAPDEEPIVVPDEQPVVVDDEEMPAALRDDDKALSTQILQFFLFPMLLVVTVLAIMVVFGVISSSNAKVEDLLLDLQFGSHNKRQQAAYHLAKQLNSNPELAQDEELPDALLNILETKTELTTEMRQYILLAGSKTGDTRFSPIIVGELEKYYQMGIQQQEELEHMEAAYFIALENLADEGVLEKLLKFHERDNEATRKMVIHAIDPIDDPRVVELLVKSLNDDYIDVVWNAALKLAAAPRFDQRAVPVIKKMLDREYVSQAPEINIDQVRDVLMMASYASAGLRHPDLKPGLEKLSDTDPDLRVKNAAREAISRYNDPSEPGNESESGNIDEAQTVEESSSE